MSFEKLIRIPEDRVGALIGKSGKTKLKIEEGFVTRDELYIADEVFLTGTAAEITPVREIDNRTIGNGRRGKTTSRIQKMFFEIVHGSHKKFNKWLSEV